MARWLLFVLALPLLACGSDPIAPTPLPVPTGQPSIISALCYAVPMPTNHPKGYQLFCPGDPGYDPTRVAH